MVNILPFLILVSVLLMVGQIALMVYLRNEEKAFLDDIAKAFGLPRQEKRNWALWQRAFKKSQDVLGEAELESVRVVANAKSQTRQLESLYESQLRAAMEEMEKEFGKFLVTLKEESRKAQDLKDKELATLVGDGYVAFTKRLEERLSQIEKETLALSVEEAKKVRAEVKSYKEKAMAAIDASATEVLDRVVTIVLGKKLKDGNQADLIVEALEQAKREGFVT